MNDKTGDVKKYYDTHFQAEDQRLAHHVLELPLTLEYIEKHVPKNGKILDLACGTGWYADALLKRDYFLGLNDLSEENTRLTKERVGDSKKVLFSSTADALELDIGPKEAWDAVLLLGPLYHLKDEKARLQLLQKARDAVIPGGVVFSGFMSRAAAMVFGMKHNPGGIFNKDGARGLWETGTDTQFVEGTRWFINAHFVFPEEVNPMVQKAGLHPVHLVGIEGIFGERMELFHAMEPDQKEAWREFIHENCEDTHMVNLSKHLLSVSRK